MGFYFHDLWRNEWQQGWDFWCYKEQENCRPWHAKGDRPQISLILIFMTESKINHCLTFVLFFSPSPLSLSLSHSLCVKSLKEVRESLVFSNDEWKMIHLACCKSLFAFEHNWVLTISSIIDSCLLLQCGSLFNLDRIKFSYIYLILFFNKSKCIAQHII